MNRPRLANWLWAPDGQTVGFQLTITDSKLRIAAMKPTTLLTALLCMQALSLCAGSLQDIPLQDIDGKETSLKPYQGKVVLIVNVASHCGYTPQYKGLESIYERYKDKGLVVVGFPCNQFGAQEPGTSQEIKEFCSGKYNVTFPLFSKIEVNGPKRHPLYVALAGKDSPFPGDIKWNFSKFLVGRDGKILNRFEPGTTPESPELTSAIDAALAAK
jgi:glutathione peroxidase